ncbi:MAG: 1-acyl-sn-glycerol-3-phosphate acyltransferase [Bdellovibrionaceae bacterium]|nr:1-acyl-sn-glycerol-3-phosphate acyltransferase [Pseudobdellovibrionaceae bacterium]
MPKTLLYSFSRLFWSIYFVLTIGVIGLIFGYLLTLVIYLAALAISPFENASRTVRHFGEDVQCQSIRFLLRMQPWLLCQTNFKPIQGFYEQFGTRRVLFVANHRSNLDTFLLISYIPGLRGLAKSSLFYNIFFAPFMLIAGFIPVSKGSTESFVKGLKKLGRKLLKRDRPVLIFAENTRCDKGFPSMNKFAAAFFALAIDSEALIVPIAIERTDNLLGRGDLLLNPFEKVRLTMLPPVDATKFNDSIALRDVIWGQVKAALA